MKEKELKCTSCKVSIANLAGAVRFLCPNCGKIEIIRCSHCRQIGAKYECKGCGFSGPN